MSQTDQAEQVSRLRLLLSTTIIVASIIVIVIGLQSHQANSKASHAADTAKSLAAATSQQAKTNKAQIQCINKWAEKFTATTRERVDQRGKLDAAKKAREDAIDNVFLVFVRASTNPNDPDLRAEFDTATHKYNVALIHLRSVEANSDQLDDASDYPHLDC